MLLQQVDLTSLFLFCVVHHLILSHSVIFSLVWTSLLILKGQEHESKRCNPYIGWRESLDTTITLYGDSTSC